MSEEQIHQYRQRYRRREELTLDRGHGECQLRRPALRGLVTEPVQIFNALSYDIDAFVIMPNHVHLILQTRESYSRAREIRGFSARRCNQLLKRTGNAFWQTESWDRIVRDTTELRAFRNYIAENPAKAGLRDGKFTLEIYNALETYE